MYFRVVNQHAVQSGATTPTSSKYEEVGTRDLACVIQALYVRRNMLLVRHMFIFINPGGRRQLLRSNFKPAAGYRDSHLSLITR